MNGVAEPADELVFEFELDEPPEKVWRAVSIAELRERWLPDVLLSDSGAGFFGSWREGQLQHAGRRPTVSAEHGDVRGQTHLRWWHASSHHP